jgi:tRNA (Thr-GGU) A37 N-methylase
VGIFACRCPYRPNPIGSTTVPILDITGNVLTVKGLDAIDMTPVIDIKPYTPQYDFACKMDNQLKAAICRSVRIPEWIFRLTY